ncbi:hypothetical protein VNO77_13299 [Canavalia gladiata]|uniref:Uncharacterized protein n=1 Tax=Canavalia gladiata TaxID=3824 RepID=A0AAN9QRJ3_CANGL
MKAYRKWLMIIDRSYKFGSVGWHALSLAYIEHMFLCSVRHGNCSQYLRVRFQDPSWHLHSTSSTQSLRYKYNLSPSLHLIQNAKKQNSEFFIKKKKTTKESSSSNFPSSTVTTAGDRELAGEMNTPANPSSLSMNNARASDHPRHVFREKLDLETFLNSFSSRLV